MINHLIVVPLLLPLLMGTLIVLNANQPIFRLRILGLSSCLAVLIITFILLFQSADGPIQTYVLGDWPTPFGIVMVLDRLSAMMLCITALLGLLCLAHAVRGTDLQGKNFHALFQFQLLGINGAFLTGDIFNLFVFFEIMLLSSYGLVLHGGGGLRTRAGMHYVLLNLVGSSIFLVGVGILYAVLGTLNMADLAVRMSQAPAENAALLQAAGLILFAVFALKAALLPLCFWLPDAYGFTSAPVAALFAVMTKVGVYVILRVYCLIFSEFAGVGAGLLSNWLLPAALITLAVGVAGVTGSRDLRRITAWLVIVSVGTLLAVIGTFQRETIAAAIVYLPHTTFMTAAMFLVADLIGRQRPDAGSGLVPDRPVRQPTLLGLMFLTAAVAIGGLPPLSGFFAKVMMLIMVKDSAGTPWIWGLVLGGGLLALVALGRTGILFFWKLLPVNEPGDAPENSHAPVPVYALADVFPVAFLLGISPLLVFFGGQITEFAFAAADHVINPVHYIEAVLGPDRSFPLMYSLGGQ
ncbi:MAG: monovalent cation/H+ antiporter subunit D [Desulfotignum sp.]|nr:monovalent cation/H+ antiporter subunit D [Desulfotignum sp.]